MPFSATLSRSLVDLTTLSLLAVCISALLGMFLLFTWMQQREVKALAWWGSAYLLGAGSMLLQSMPPQGFAYASDLPGVMIFVACGMIWNGLRMFQGRTVRPFAGIIGALAWLTLCQVPIIGDSATLRIALGVVVVAGYTFFIAFELWRERRKSMLSHAAAIIIPAIHAAIFLMPLVLRWWSPVRFSDSWLTILAMETTIYGIGTAFIVMMAVKDRHVLQYRHAANIDHLTGLFNRRAFLDAAIKMQTEQGARGGPVTLLMFDLDHFKSVNDRFGHACGDKVLRLFAAVAQSGMRATDVVGRLGGEEFAAIVPEAMAAAANAPRSRSAT